MPGAKRQLKIAFVHMYDPRDPHTWSGTPSAMYAHLVRAGASVDVIGPLNRKIRFLLSPTWAACKIAGRDYHTDKVPLVIASYARQIEKRMRGRHFDAILATEPLLISRVNRPEPICYWSDAVWDLMANYYYMNPARSFSRNVHLHEKEATVKTAHAVYSSEWAAAGARRHYGIPDDKLSVIPFGPNLEIEHDRATIEAAISSRDRHSCKLLFLGAEWRRKGGDIAVQTARLLNEQGLKTQLIVAGCRVPGEKPAFLSEVGFISKQTQEGRARLADLLRSAHFLILPSRAECSAIVFSEACAFGLPIITTDTGGIETYVRQGVNGVRLPLSAGPEAYCKCIAGIFGDYAGYEAMAHAGWKEYTQRLNWELSVNQLLALL